MGTRCVQYLADGEGGGDWERLTKPQTIRRYRAGQAAPESAHACIRAPNDV